MYYIIHKIVFVVINNGEMSSLLDSTKGSIIIKAHTFIPHFLLPPFEAQSTAAVLFSLLRKTLIIEDLYVQYVMRVSQWKNSCALISLIIINEAEKCRNLMEK